jgi:ABC-type transport system involved in cytochrome c biogenesis ATPase subunit
MVARVGRLKGTFLHSMRERGTEVARRMVASDGAKTFEECWATEALHFVAAFTDRHQLTHACETRGLTGLLDVRAVKLAVGGGMSLVFGLAAERELLARVPIQS